jgi:hypothetical protein
MTTLSEHTPAEAVAKAALEYVEAKAELRYPICADPHGPIAENIGRNRSRRLDKAEWELDRLARAYRESRKGK